LTQISVVATDIDGTLLNPVHRISPAVRAAVARLSAAGVTVILASARFPGAMRAIQVELGLLGEPLVACQGAATGHFTAAGFQPGLLAPISLGATRRIIAEARNLGLAVSHFDDRQWRVQPDDSMAEQEAAIVGCEPERVPDLAALVTPPTKLTVMAPAGRKGRLAAMAQRLPADVSGAISRPDYLEIVTAGVSKASAITALLDERGVDPGELAAIGDGANDEAMLRAAAIGIAMGHAPARLRGLATWVVPSNAADGVAVAIERLFQAGLIPASPAGDGPAHS
jgi:Cof subfamily protein (haloacid dehalogenase superfamily)